MINSLIWRHLFKQSQIIHIESGKKREVFKGLRVKIFEKIDHETVKYLSMDMYPAYKGDAKEYSSTL